MLTYACLKAPCGGRVILIVCTLHIFWIGLHVTLELFKISLVQDFILLLCLYFRGRFK